MTITSPGLIRLAMIAFMQAFSESKTRAGPVMTGFFRPVIFATQPSGARLPRRMARWPSLYIGLDHGRVTCWSPRGSARAACSLRAVEGDGDKAARGLQVAQHRYPAPHALEVVDGPFHARRARDRQEVQYGI